MNRSVGGAKLIASRYFTKLNLPGGQVPPEFNSEERADILAETGLHFDGEAAFAGDVEVGSGGVCLHRGLPIEGHAARAGGDLHALRRAGAEMVAAGVDEPEGFLRAVGNAIPGLDVDVMIAGRSGADVASARDAAQRSAVTAGVTGTPTFAVGRTNDVLTVLPSSDAKTIRAALDAVLAR